MCNLYSVTKGQYLRDQIVIDAQFGANRRSLAIRIVLNSRERYDFVKLGEREHIVISAESSSWDPTHKHQACA